jgi:ATP-dependent Zn protease
MYITVRGILEQHLDMLKELAQLLLEKEVVEREEFERIVEGQKPEGENGNG